MAATRGVTTTVAGLLLTGCALVAGLGAAVPGAPAAAAWLGPRARRSVMATVSGCALGAVPLQDLPTRLGSGRS